MSNLFLWKISVFELIVLFLNFWLIYQFSKQKQLLHSQTESFQGLQQHWQSQYEGLTQSMQAITQQSQLILTQLQTHDQLLQKVTQDLKFDLIMEQQKQHQANNQVVQTQVQKLLEAQNNALSRLQIQLTQQLTGINQQVETKLNQGFAKSNQLFCDMLQRLTIIDQAQQKITALSQQVGGLQSVLDNKQARGHFGEIQLSQLIENCLPKKHYALQHTLSNGKRADCVLFLPEPTGNIVIDAKFPLENYRKLKASDDQSTRARTQFKQDVKTHIKDIANKYVDFDKEHKAALMFLPAESIFAECFDHHPDVVDFAYEHKVWLVSPTTLMAVLHTIQALLKDMQTQEQVHIIQQHLQHLSQDFQRFQSRMHLVAKHIADAQEKVGQVNISAEKIVKRFHKIENCELKDNKSSDLLSPLSIETNAD